MRETKTERKRRATRSEYYDAPTNKTNIKEGISA
jgi:hypothetical protein